MAGPEIRTADPERHRASAAGPSASAAGDEDRDVGAGSSISGPVSRPSGSGDSRDGGAGSATGLTNDELGSKVRAMVIASLTDQDLAAAARARGYSLVKVVDFIGAHSVSVAIPTWRGG